MTIINMKTTLHMKEVIMAKSVAYPISPEVAAPRVHWTVSRPVEASAKSNELCQEDIEIVAALNEAASDMAFIHSCFDHITEELLIDCLIYELKAASLRHKYFHDLCKEKGIVAGSP